MIKKIKIAITSDQIKEISNYLEEEFQFKIPNIFLPTVNNNDIEAFIDIEELMLSNFEFQNSEVNELGINDLLKIKGDKDFSEEKIEKVKKMSEPKTWGLGYANNSKNGRGASKVAGKIADFFRNSSIEKNEERFRKAKLSGSEDLMGISSDKITDFILSLKLEEWREITHKLIERAIIDLKIYNFNSIQFINKLIEISNQKDFFPFLIPMELCSRIDYQNIFGNEFIYEKIKEFFIKSKLDDDLKYFESILKLKEDDKIEKIVFQKRLNELREINGLNKFISSESTIKISNLLQKEEVISNFNDLRKMKLKRYEVDFILKRQIVLKKLGLSRFKIFVNELNLIYSIFLKNNKIIIIVGKEKKQKTKSIIDHIRRMQKFKKYDIYILKFSKTSSFKDDRVKTLMLEDDWNIL